MAIKPLRLRAVDAEDLAVIAACLQDALVPLTEMAYLAEQGRFVAAFARFRRECLADPECCDGLTLCHTALTFDEVRQVRYRGVDTRFGRVKLALLTMIAEPGAGDTATITLLFAGDAAIQLTVGAITARLEDFGEPWPAKVAPAHAVAAAAEARAASGAAPAESAPASARPPDAPRREG